MYPLRSYTYQVQDKEEEEKHKTNLAHRFSHPLPRPDIGLHRKQQTLVQWKISIFQLSSSNSPDLLSGISGSLLAILDKYFISNKYNAAKISSTFF